MNPLLSIFEKCKGSKVRIRPEVLKSVKMLINYYQMQCIEGARRVSRSPAHYDADGVNRLQTYYENAGAFLCGVLPQLEQTFDSRALAVSAVSLVTDDLTLGDTLRESVTAGLPETDHVPGKPVRGRGEGRADGVARKRADGSGGKAVPRRVRKGAG